MDEIRLCPYDHTMGEDHNEYDDCNVCSDVFEPAFEECSYIWLKHYKDLSKDKELSNEN